VVNELYNWGSYTFFRGLNFLGEWSRGGLGFAPICPSSQKYSCCAKLFPCLFFCSADFSLEATDLIVEAANIVAQVN